MAEPRHLAFPLRLSSSGALATNVQGSDEDIESGIAVVLSYPLGSRRDRPRFGIPDELGEYPDVEAIRSAVALNEPLASFSATLDDELIKGGAALIDLGFDPTGGS